MTDLKELTSMMLPQNEFINLLVEITSEHTLLLSNPKQVI